MDSSTFGLVLGWIIGAVVGLLALYLVIRYAVLHALFEYTKRATLGVSIVSANPVRVVQHDEAEQRPRAEADEQ